MGQIGERGGIEVFGAGEEQVSQDVFAELLDGGCLRLGTKLAQGLGIAVHVDLGTRLGWRRMAEREG